MSVKHIKYCGSAILFLIFINVALGQYKKSDSVFVSQLAEYSKLDDLNFCVYNFCFLKLTLNKRGIIVSHAFSNNTDSVVKKRLAAAIEILKAKNELKSVRLKNVLIPVSISINTCDSLLLLKQPGIESKIETSPLIEKLRIQVEANHSKNFRPGEAYFMGILGKILTSLNSFDDGSSISGKNYYCMPTLYLWAQK